jgi:hypothetical protein
MSWRQTALLFLLVPGTSLAQSVVYEGGFERAVNRYRWNGLLETRQEIQGWNLAVSDRFRSDAFLLFDDRLSFRDLNSFRLSADRPLAASTRMVVRARSDWFSLSRVLSRSLYAGVAWSGEKAALTPLVGVAMDRRPGARTADGQTPIRSDIGPAYGITLAVPQREVGGYAVELAGEGYREHITPRRSSVARLRGSAERSFEQTRLRADIQMGTARRDAYQAASFLNRGDTGNRLSETVESTRSDTVNATLGLVAPLPAGLEMSGSIAFNANNRRVRTLRSPAEALVFDSDFNRRAVDVESGLSYRRGSTQIRMGVQAGAEIERRRLTNESSLPGTQAAQKRDLLRQADYDQGYLTLQATARLPLASKLVLLLDGSANTIRHDTPIINPDDRDELFFSGRLGILYRPSRVLEAEIQLLGTRYHTVYLKERRSAENNVQEGLRLRPGIRWRPSRRTRVFLNAEVRATYTIDDFTLPGRRPTDQSARELRYNLDLEHQFAADNRILAEAQFSDLRLGRFLDEVFAEIPIDTLRTYGGWIRLQTGSRVTAEIGLRFFIRTDYDRSATVRYPRVGLDGEPVLDAEGRTLESTISRPGRKRIAQIGPTAALVWPMRDGVLRFEGWYTAQRVSRSLYGDLPEGSAAAIRKAARHGDRIIIPNLALSMRWNI